jgi:hypothetical protein
MDSCSHGQNKRDEFGLELQQNHARCKSQGIEAVSRTKLFTKNKWRKKFLDIFLNWQEKNWLLIDT